MSKAAPVDIKSLFLGLQQKMLAAMTVTQQVSHPTAKGTATEQHWTKMLSDYLPERYAVTNGFAIDSNGSLSDQQDIIIYDRHYTPFLLNHNDARYIPAEGVYAIFEVKQTLNQQYVTYAAAKAASVRKLRRTSAPISHASGIASPRPPIPILAGLVCTDSEWREPAVRLSSSLPSFEQEERLDLICVLAAGTHQCTYEPFTLVSSAAEVSLIAFFLNLLARLQSVGTVPAMDYTAYVSRLQ